MRYLIPNHQPPTREDYDELYAQFVALILSTGKVEAYVPHSVRHPFTRDAGPLVIAKEIDDIRHQTIYTVVPAP